MKKLMIAAAVAALVGGAFADTAYTFTASVKTTVGKAGKTTTTYYLGMDDGGAFWYNDAGETEPGAQEGDPEVIIRKSIVQLKADKLNYFTTKTVNGRTIDCLSNEAKKDYTWLKENIVPLTFIYDQKSANKWCETFKVVDEGCYRVAGTKKFKAIVSGEALCCSDLVSVEDEDTVVSITPSLTQRFGGLTYATAKKAEVIADVTVADNARVADGKIAGQGSIGKVLDSEEGETYMGITSLSGNFVGELDAPVCVNCCTDPTPAIAFDCDDEIGDVALTTAGYGTFSIKYNAKATKALALE